RREGEHDLSGVDDGAVSASAAAAAHAASTAAAASTAGAPAVLAGRTVSAGGGAVRRAIFTAPPPLWRAVRPAASTATSARSAARGADLFGPQRLAVLQAQAKQLVALRDAVDLSVLHDGR